ncbi:MAG: hypothetical protein H7Z12_16960 [Rhodospirillaceae bacterium]|nr:hypothetical protein [Rhodospirillales bacterium]
MKSIARRAALLGLSALLLAGCGSRTSLPQTQAGDPQQPMDFKLLTDIPIPSGATMDNERSLILGDHDRWTGRVVMKLWKSAPDATNFYQQQMPSFGWEPIMAATSGISVMSYVRGERAATVQVESTMLGSAVSVTVGPRANGLGAGAGASSSMPGPAPPGYYDAPPKAAPMEKVRSEPLPTTRR